jgi:thiosulfate reductase cytochrome b subunit
MNASRERNVIRILHLVLSIPIVGFIYGPVANIPQAAWFTRFVAVPIVVLSGIWLWQKPRVLRWVRRGQVRAEGHEGQI